MLRYYALDLSSRINVQVEPCSLAVVKISV